MATDNDKLSELESLLKKQKQVETAILESRKEQFGYIDCGVLEEKPLIELMRNEALWRK